MKFILIFSLALVAMSFGKKGKSTVIFQADNQTNINYYSRAEIITHPYYISPIEMRSLWTEMKYIKSAARLLDRDWVNKRGLDLSKKVLWVSFGQRALELQAVKIGSQQKILPSGLVRTRFARAGPIGRIFCCPPTLKACSSGALWPTDTHSTSLERSKPLLLTEYLFKRLEVV